MAANRLYLDANIFILAFENNDEVSRKLLDLISLNENTKVRFLTTSELTLAELMVEPLRKNIERLIEIYDNLTIGNAFIHVGTVSRDVLWNAALLRAENSSLRLPDAIHLSTALHFGCAYFLSADKRLKGTYSLAADRHIPKTSAAKISIVQPDISKLDALIHEFSA